MGPEVKTAERRKLNRELERLRDPRWKPPKKHFPAVLLAHSKLYMAGVMSFWSSNTFAFEDPGSLAKFTDSARSEVLSSITSLRLGPDYCYEDGADGNSTVFRWKDGKTKAHQNISFLGCFEIAPDQILPSMPSSTLDKLHSLMLHYYILSFSLNKFSVDVLPYTKDLHSGAWSQPPDVANRKVNYAWLEAKAAELD
ncbi:hypothetical protein LTS10_002738 [Elasticomyces elasticus]|nr:hypothetical protein LTS10_002738 [Elasticomyces elasticus]